VLVVGKLYYYTLTFLNIVYKIFKFKTHNWWELSHVRELYQTKHPYNAMRNRNYFPSFTYVVTKYEDNQYWQPQRNVIFHNVDYIYYACRIYVGHLENI